MQSGLTFIIFPLVFLAGFVDAIAGGGGIISVTSYFAIGLPSHLALGTNKFSSTLGTAVSTGQFIRKGHIRWDAAIVSAIAALVASAIGARVVLLIDARIVSYLVIGIVPFIALFLILKKDMGTVEKDLPTHKVLLYSALVSLVVGAYDGFFGPGTGTFLIMGFTQIVGMSLLTACGNAKVINLASNVAALVTFIASGNVYYALAVPCAACGILGNYLGARLAMKRGARIVRPMMMVVVGLLLVKILFDLLG